ncbi:MAG: hypothetical protein NZ901_09165 [Geminocystis sp.]|nr:hypothetical protein [Geminocystis sp.]HIK38932.1 hypothetical protein [Geminocystis sp. M7585_C2015_104]MCS7148344.1 hypothetical protein [Geminocystis sp.]MCX8078342.1 hypothetical protein [Geminocystis sp.]MDW8116068.1 hypothetical protein [Geminocystis sp.]
MNNNSTTFRGFFLIVSGFALFSLGDTLVSANPSCYLIDSSGRRINLESLCKKTAVSSPTTQSPNAQPPNPQSTSPPFPPSATSAPPNNLTPSQPQNQSSIRAGNPAESNSNATATEEGQQLQFIMRGRRLILIPSKQK